MSEVWHWGRLWQSWPQWLQWQKWLQQRDNGVNDQNGFSGKGSRVWQSYCQCFNTLISRLLNEHCVGSLDRISKFLGSSSTPFPWLGTRQSTGFALPVWPLRVCACPAAGFGFMNSTTLCTKNSTLRVYMKKFTLYWPNNEASGYVQQG